VREPGRTDDGVDTRPDGADLGQLSDVMGKRWISAPESPAVAAAGGRGGADDR